MKFSKNSFINNINQSYCEGKDQQVTRALISLTGQENYRPRLDDLKKYLKNEIEDIESFSKVIVIGGTNGKGETSHCLRQLLLENDDSVMMWTSPHVLTITERFIINNEVISYEILENEIASIKQDAIDLGLSFYELLLAVFLKYACIIRPKYLILEVGLGGRFDGVNLFKNPLTAITSISRDHTKILGSKLSEILFEKYGITRSGGSLFSSIDQIHLRETLTSWCQRDKIELTYVEGKSYKERNRLLASSLYSVLTSKNAPEKLDWLITKGRHEEIYFRDVHCVFIGAHNLDGHRKSLELLNQSVQNTCSDSLNTIVLMSFSIGREDQIEDILQLYLKYPCLFKDLFLTSFKDSKAMDADLIISSCPAKMKYVENWTSIFNEENKDKTIYITGSYYFIAAVQRYIYSFK